MSVSIQLDLAGLPAEVSALIVGKVDLGAGSNGDVVLLDSVSQVLVTIPLGNPAFSQVAATARYEVNGVPLQATATASGTAVSCRYRDANGDTVFSGPASAVGGSGFALLDNTEIEVDDTVTLVAGSIETPTGA